jgi:hypothetical protein
MHGEPVDAQIPMVVAGEDRALRSTGQRPRLGATQDDRAGDRQDRDQAEPDQVDAPKRLVSPSGSLPSRPT